MHAWPGILEKNTWEPETECSLIWLSKDFRVTSPINKNLVTGYNSAFEKRTFL